MISKFSSSSTPAFVGFVLNGGHLLSARGTWTLGRRERMRLNNDRWTRYDIEKCEPNRALPLTDERRPYRSEDRRSATTGPVDDPVNDGRNVGEDSSEYQDVDAAWVFLNGFAGRGFRG